MADKQSRVQFATRLGAIATTVGSAVGLGNIWRFPYEAGQNGGGAFLLVDLFFIFIVGIPVVCAEFMMGRHTGLNVCGAFRRLCPRSAWVAAGYIGLVASVLILSFYSVVAGWTLEYIYQSLTGFGGQKTVEGLHEHFALISSSDWRQLLFTLLFLLINYLILARGVTKGIERMSNIMMPLFFAILIFFCINSVRMPKAAEGLAFLFTPHFDKITPSVLLNGMGQAFFSLSLGLGCLVTYSSYFKKDTPLVRTASITASLDMMVSILAGIIIFPAIFTFGQEPAAGSKLVFEVFPAIFQNMPAGTLWSTLFFILLFLASLSSTISMSEISIAYFVDEMKLSRRNATLLNTILAVILGSLCALSFGSLSSFTICGYTIFALFDFVTSNILLPLGGMCISIFVGWVVDKALVKGELVANGSRLTPVIASLIVFCLRYIAPVCIAMVFISGLL